ncbi:uncharacterized protein [Rutidosis leptorrhynchoides]|uniref:uncharacterized protein n=1 Tax=Rutidosis leptorrhynchoides TaxID=125765 RepID=UPI003A98D20A
MSQEQGYVEGKLTMKNMLTVIPQVKKMLTERQEKLFRSTCFGPWLDLSYTGNDPGLVHAMLQRKCERSEKLDASKYPEEQQDIWFHFSPNFMIRFGRREFCLVTGFMFGSQTDMAHYIPRNYESKTAPIRRRCFPERPDASNILVSDIQNILIKKQGDVKVPKVSDDDIVRLAIILIVERAFMGKQGQHVVSKQFLWLVEDFNKVNVYPWGSRIWDATYSAVSEGFEVRESQLESGGGKAYTLAGFMWAFKIWILEAYRRTIKSFATKTDKDGVPRALFWKRSSAETFTVSDYLKLLHIMDDCPKRKRPFRSLHPSETERGCQWWIQSSSYFQGDVVEDEKNTQDDNQVEEDLGGSLKELLQEESEQTSDPHPTQKGNKLQELLRMVNMLTNRVDDQEKELADCKKKLDDHEKRLKEQEHQEHQYADNEDAYVDPRSFSDNDTSPRVVRRGKRERRPTHFLNSPFTTPGYRKPLEKLSDEVASRVKRLKVSHQGTKEAENVLPMETEKPTEKGAEKAVDKQDENVALVSEEIEQGVDLPLVNEAEKQADQHDVSE